MRLSKQKIVSKKKQNAYRTIRSRISHLYCDIGRCVRVYFMWEESQREKRSNRLPGLELKDG